MQVPRFTIRRAMLMLAVLAVGLWFGRTWKDSADYQRVAEFYAYQERVADVRADNVENGGIVLPGYSEDEKRQFVVSSRRSARHLAALKRKYNRAARYPWLPIARDAPLPQ